MFQRPCRRINPYVVGLVFMHKKNPPGVCYGTGTIINPRGLILTANHVLRDDDWILCQGRSKFGPLRRSKSRPVGEGVAVFVGRRRCDGARETIRIVASEGGVRRDAVRIGKGGLAEYIVGALRWSPSPPFWRDSTTATRHGNLDPICRCPFLPSAALNARPFCPGNMGE